MTRDEAIAKIINLRMYYSDHRSYADAGDFVSVLETLGVLKLDEPKSIEPRSMRDRINDARCRLPQSERGISGFLQAIDDAGLKIVEK